MHGEAKTQHGLRPAVRRGLANVAIHAHLTAAVINLKRLARALEACFDNIYGSIVYYGHKVTRIIVCDEQSIKLGIIYNVQGK